MNPEAFDYAYELFVKDGYKKTKKEFYDLLNSNPEALQVAYELFVADGYTKDINAFSEIVGVGQGAEVGLKKKDASELPPETGSLVSSEDNTLDFSSRLGFVPEDEEESLLDARILAKQNIREDLIGMDETEAAKYLRDNFARYGFVFEESSPGINQLYVRTADGNKQIKVDLELENVRYTGGVTREIKKLQDFIANNAKGAYNVAEEDFLAKAHRANNMRPIGRINDDGSESTVLMASAEFDGVNYAFPTLFPKEGNTKSMKPSDWVEYDVSTDVGFNKAFNEAMTRGELFAFETEQEAIEFAEGAWKGVNTIDYEADQFFKERGLNYRDIKKAREEYDRVSDELDMLEGIENAYYSSVDAGVAKQLAAKLGITGSVFEDTMITYEGEKVRYGDVVDRLQAEQDKYASLLFDVGGESPQDALDQWDMYLEGELKKKSQRAVRQSQQTTANIEAIRRASLLTFGVQPEDLPTMQIPKESEQAAQALHDMYMMEKKDLEYAYDQFDIAKTYFDEKTNKQIQEVAVENLEGFAEMWKQGGGNGDALVQIMGVQMGVIDIEDKASRDEVIAKIIDAKERATGPTSLVVAGSMESRSLGEWFQYAGDDPFEWSTSLMAQSLSMMLPVGKFVAPTIIAPTVALYSSIPSIAGPEGTLAGGVAGLLQGTRLAFAATNFMVEYTNAFFDTMNERGLDAMNPQQLEAALMDDSVWEDTNTRGLSRGIPIALVDYFGARVAGRVLGTGLSTGGKAIAKIGAEQLIAGPGFEAIGETAAQITANLSSGRSAFDINWAEVSAEAGGAFGNNFGNTALNSFMMARSTVNNSLVDKMQSPAYINRLDVSDSKIQEWVKNMRAMRRITPEMEQRILENVGARREANKILTGSVNPSRQPKSATRSRLMQLITARDKIAEMADSKAFRNVLSAIDEEIQFMAENGVMKAPDQRVDLTKKGLTNILYSGQGRYRWGKDSLTKAEFLGRLNNATDEELQKEMDGPLGVVVANDPEVEQQVNDRINAIQEQSTDEVSVRDEAAVGEEVGEEVQDTEELTGEEEVTPAEEEAEVEVDEQELSDLEKLYGGERKDATRKDAKDARRGKKDEAVLATIADKLEASGGQINALTRNERKVYEAQGDEVQAVLEERKRLAQEAQEQERERAIQAVIDAMLEEMRARMTQPEETEEVEVEEREPITYGDIKNYEYKFADGSSEYVQVRQLSDGRQEIVVGMRKNDKNQLRDIHTTMIMDADYDFEANPEEVITMEEGAQLVITKPQTAEELELREFRDEAFDETDLTVDPDADIDQELRFSLEEEQEGEVELPTELFGQWTDKVMDKFFDTSEGYDAIKPVMVELARRGYITKHPFQPDSWVFADPDNGSTELDVQLMLAPVRDENGNAQPNKLYIDLIAVLGDKNKGAGTRAMNMLTSIADDLGFDIELQAWPPMREQTDEQGRDLSEEQLQQMGNRLVEFYKKFGFDLKAKQTRRGETDMVRVASKTQEPRFKMEVPGQVKAVIAPFFDTTFDTVAEAIAARDSQQYQDFVSSLEDIAESLGMTATVQSGIGGYTNEAGKDIVELSTTVTLDGANIDQAVEYAALFGALAPEAQEATIAAEYVEEGSENHNANEYEFVVSDLDAAVQALKNAGFEGFSVDDANNTVSVIDVLDFADPDLLSKLDAFANELTSKDVSYEAKGYRAVDSRYIDKQARQAVIRRLSEEGSSTGQNREFVRALVSNAVAKDAEFRGITEDEYLSKQPKRGNRLFNEPLEEVAAIADRYFEAAFGRPRPRFEGTREIDTERAKRIADAYDAMENDPTNPRVRRAYEAMVKETIAQYEAILAANYVIEVNNEEPYANSAEMIEDLRVNRRIKIFSTESGFGDTGITEQQRRENPLLARTKYTDVNGVPLLANDLFRAVHDFFGHAELGNSFGPKGEENAWNVHVRMYSPLAAAAMTSETRGQNSYVNFSGVNERADAMRAEAARLRDQGRDAEAQALVEKIYEEISFADQKVGLLPEEFWTPDEVQPDVRITEVESNNPSFNREIAFETDGGRAEILEFTKKDGTVGYTGFSFFVDEDRRNQGIGTKLLDAILEYTDNNFSAQVSSAPSVAVNYKRGLKIYRDGKAIDGVIEGLKYFDTRPGLGVFMMTDKAAEERGYKEKTLLAPNGKKSNLSPELHYLVRTPEFKNWFGDWENDPANASKVLDENGEPLVVYHGSPSVDITQFDELGAKQNRMSGLKEGGFYFTSNRNLAELYAEGRAEAMDKAASDSRVYPMFLNLRDPFVHDGKSRSWPKWADDIIVEINPYYAKRGLEAVQYLLGQNSFASSPYDGVIVKNANDVVTSDFFSETIGDDYEGTLFIVPFDRAEAMKLADGSNYQFSPLTGDIRFMAQEIQPTSEEARESIKKDSTNLKITGKEEVEAGANAPTIRESRKPKGKPEEVEFAENYSIDDLFNDNKGFLDEKTGNFKLGSRGINFAMMLASGEFTYTKRVGGKSVRVVVKLPYENKEALSLLKRRINQYKKLGGGKDALKKKQEVANRIIDLSKDIISDMHVTMTQNILAVYDTLTDDFIESSKEWYVGANRMANKLAKNYNISVEQAAGVIAALSPQNDWFNNVTVAERTLEIMANYADTRLTEEMYQKTRAYNQRSVKKGELSEYTKTLDRLWDVYKGASINEMEAMGAPVTHQADMLRALDQALLPNKVLATSPDGDFIGYDKIPIRWNSTTEIAKAINMARTNDPRVVAENLGGGSKVRNFYNNIVDPLSETDYLTADTHALSVALGAPISANDAGGFGLFKPGFNPAYMLVKDAYIDAARIAGLAHAREMQSITWEAMRTGVNDASRTEAQKKANAELLNKLLRDQSLSPYERARIIVDANRSKPSVWATARGIETQRGVSELREGLQDQADERVSDSVSVRRSASRDVGAAIAGLGRATKLTEEEKAQADIKAMARFGDPAGLSGLQASPEFIEEVNKRLKAIFPDVELFVTDEAWARLMEMPEVKKSIEGIRGRLGGKVEFRGLALGRGAVYVNPDVFRSGTKSFNVTIHEYGHIWFKALQTTEKGRALRKRGMGLAAKTELFQDVRRRFPDTPAGIFNAAEETLIIMVGNRGQDIINETLKQKFKNWLTEMWEFIRSRLKLSKDLTIEEIGNLNLSEFVDIAVGDILFGGFREEQSQKQENDAASRFLINFDIDEDGLYKVIREGRENGFSDASIRYYLRQQGFSAEQVDSAMAVPIDLERNMPEAFGNVPGGVNAGMRIYREVMAELDRFAHSGPRGGRRREVTKTFGEIRQKAHDILSSREDFQQFNDTLKKQMLIGLDRSIGITENDKVSANVKQMKETLRQRVLGQKELRQAQKEMRKFLRNNLPDDMRNKADIQRLMKLVQDTDMGNLRVVIDQGIATLEKIAARDKKVAEQVSKLKEKLANNRMSARELEQARLEARVFIRKNMPKSKYGNTRVDRFMTMASNATPDTYDKNGKLTRDSISNVISRAIDEITRQRVSDLEADLKKAMKTGTTFLTVGRLKGKISPEAQDRIVSLKTLLASPDASIDAIQKLVESLRAQYEELSNKGEVTTEDAQKMMDLDIAINYNAAMTMENNEQAKVDALEAALNGFVNILTEARNDFKELMRQQREYYNSLKSAFFTDVSGIAIDFNDPESVAQARELLAELKVKELKTGLAAQALKKLLNPVDQLLTRTEALEGLLDRVSQMPGEMFGGVSRELILDRINESSRDFKAGKMMVLTLLDAKAQEIYGKDYRKIMQRNGYQTEFYYINPEKAAELQGKIEVETDSRKVKALTKQLEGLKMPISQNDMYYLYNQFKDEANHPGFATKFGRQYTSIMEEITSKLDPKVKEWADWQVEEFYPSVYDRYNEVYRQIYRTNMPWNDKYAGRIIRERENMDTVDDFLTSTVYQTAVGSNSTKVRVRNSNAIKTRNGDSALNSYINEMEFFRAYAENMRDIIKMVRTPEVRTAIETVSGKDVYSILTTMLDRVMTRQMARETEASIIGFMSSGFVTANLGLNPTIYLKQATSALAFAGYIGYGNWFKYAALAGLDSIKNWRTQWSELYANSPVLQDRYEFSNITKVLENYTDQDTTLTVRGKAIVPATVNEKIMNVMMFLVKQGDKLGVMGAIPNYVYYKNAFMEKNPSATEQQAIDFAVKKVEVEATSTQQDSGVQNKDFYQTGNELQRFFSLFLSSPKALFRKEVIAARNLYRKAAAFDRAAGKGTVGQNLRNLLTYHLVVPMLFQYVALGLPGLARPFGEEDKEDMTWAAVLGNLNAVFALGDIAVGIANAIQGKPWASDLRNLPILMVAGDLIDNLSKYRKAVEKADTAKTPEGRNSNNAKAEEHLMKIVDQLANITGLPYANVRKLVNNIAKLSDSKDPGEVILRLLNYGEYTIQRGKEEEKGKSGMSKSDMRLMFPELYEDVYGNGTPYYERQQMKRELNEEKRQMKREAVN